VPPVAVVQHVHLRPRPERDLLLPRLLPVVLVLLDRRDDDATSEKYSTCSPGEQIEDVN